MNTKGRKLLRYAAGFITAAFLIVAAYTTTAMASGIGLIDTADLLDIHAEADDSSAVVGQVMDEGHVAILGESDGWVQIQAGDIIGWVPEGNLIVTEVSNEEAVEANEELFAEIQESAEEANEKAAEDVAAEDETAEEILKADTSEEEEAMRVNASEAIEENADVPSEDRKEAAAQQTEQEMAELSAVGQGAEDVEESSEEMQTEELEAQQFAMELQKEADAQKLAAELQKKAEAEAAAVQKAQEEALRAAEAAAAQKAQEEALRAAEAAALEAQRQAEAAALEAQRQAEAAALEAQRQAEAAALESRKQNTLAAAGVTEEELYLLANIIYCEAGCEPYIGKVAVGNVVMNRVKSDKQPDTISEVVYAKGQFSPVSNGSLARALKRGSADESCYQAALEALEGASPVGDKLFFRRVNGRSGQVIGHHVFY